MDNACSDGPLQRAINQYTNEYNHDFLLIKIGLAFSVLSFIASVVSICLLGPFGQVILSFFRNLTQRNEALTKERKNET